MSDAGKTMGPNRLRVILVAAALLVAMSCSERRGGLGSEPVETAASSTEVELVDSTETVPGGESASAMADGLELPAEHPGTPFMRDFIAVHGPTDDLSATLATVADFPPLPTPAGTHVVDVLLTGEEGSLGGFQVVRFVADGSIEELQRFFEIEFRDGGWERVESAVVENDAGFPQVEMRFNSERDGSVSLKITTDDELPETLVSLSRLSFADASNNESRFVERIHGIFDPAPVPDGPGAYQYQADSFWQEGRTKVTITGIYRHLDGRFDDADEQAILDAVAARAESMGLDGRASGSSYQLTDALFEDRLMLGPDLESGTNVRIDGERRFPTPSFDAPRPVAGDDEITDPIADGATAEEIELILAQIHGPTNDMAEQVRRLGLFPDMPTPLGSEIAEVGVRVNPAGDAETVTSRAVIDVSGGFDDLVAFYETQFAALGYESVDAEEADTGSDARRFDAQYNIPGVDGGGLPALFLTVSDDPDRADVRVSFLYSEILAAADSIQPRLLGWIGESPLPAGGALNEVSISSVDVNDRVTFQVLRDYPELAGDQVLANVENGIDRSDYDLASASASESEDSPVITLTPVGEWLGLSHPLFERPRVELVDTGGDGASARLVAYRLLPLR